MPLLQDRMCLFKNEPASPSPLPVGSLFLSLGFYVAPMLLYTLIYVMCDCVNIEFLNWVVGQDIALCRVFLSTLLALPSLLGTVSPHFSSLDFGLALLHINSTPRSSLASPADSYLETVNLWPVMSLTRDVGCTHSGCYCLQPPAPLRPYLRCLPFFPTMVSCPDIPFQGSKYSHSKR